MGQTRSIYSAPTPGPMPSFHGRNTKNIPCPAPSRCRAGGAFPFCFLESAEAEEAGQLAAVATALVLLGLAAAFGSGGGSGGLDLLGHLQADLHGLALAVEGEGDPVSGLAGADGLHQVVAAGDLGVIDLRDDVVDLESGGLGGAVIGQALDGSALRQAVLLGLIADADDADADIGLLDIALLDDAGDDIVHIVHGDGEADVVDGGAGAGGAGILGVGDAHHFTVHVEQSAAGVAGIDGAVGLDQLLGAAGGHGHIPVQGADGTGRQGEGQLAQRVADGHYAVAYIQLAGGADDHRGQALGLHLQHGHIVALVVADDLGIILGAVVGGDGHRIGAFNDVVIGDDIAVIREDEAGTGRRGLGLLAPEVGGHGRSHDTNGRVDVGGVDLSGGKLLGGVDLLDLQHAGFPDPLHDGGHTVSGDDGLGQVPPGQRRAQEAAAHTHAASQQGTDQGQCHALLAAVFLVGLLGLVNRGHIRRDIPVGLFLRVFAGAYGFINGIIIVFTHGITLLLPIWQAFFFSCPYPSRSF